MNQPQSNQAVALPLRRRQLQIFWLCWLLYALAYLGRTNLSVALSSMQGVFSGSKTLLGLLGTLFYWTYAAGKLINGYAGDYVNNKRMIFYGVILAGLSNIGMGLLKTPVLLLLLWSVNGFAQSLLWCNMLRIVARWFTPKQQGTMAVFLNTSIMAGSLLGMGGGGVLISVLPWQWTFLLPGLLLLLGAVLWGRWGQNSAADAGFTIQTMVQESGAQAEKPQKLRPFILSSGLLVVMVACLAQGVVKDSIGLWGPVMLEEQHHIGAGAASIMLLVIPVANFFGVLLMGMLNKKGFRTEVLAGMMMAIGALCLVWLRVCTSTAVYILLLAVISTLMYGVNTLLLGLYPLRFWRENRVSFVSGFLDASSYVAAGASSFMIGQMLDHGQGWSSIFAIWLALTAVGIGALFISKHKMANH
ncbi:MAG: MFS transporter [Clostridia bacterium]